MNDASRVIRTRHGTLELPAFLPDATRGVVRCTDAAAVAATGTRALMANSFLLSRRPGARRIRSLGGLHKFMGWSGVIATDSGGFQVLSLIRENSRNGTIRSKGVLFRGLDSRRKTWLTPATAVRNQLLLDSDVVIALDDCTHPHMNDDEQRLSVERTISWYRETRVAFDASVDVTLPMGKRPLLVGVAQGGTSPDLRRRCLEAILELGTDAVGFGGWPIDADGKLLVGMFQLLHDGVPPSMPIFALGVGKPEHLAALCQLRRNWVFDCSLPTKDARRGRLYVFLPNWESVASAGSPHFYRNVRLGDAKHAADENPVDPSCDCACCAASSLAYLHHMVKVNETLVQRLATIHNLRFYSRLVSQLKT